MDPDILAEFVSRSRNGGGASHSKRRTNSVAIARDFIATERDKRAYLAPYKLYDNVNENDDKGISSQIDRDKRVAEKTAENVYEGCSSKVVHRRMG